MKFSRLFALACILTTYSAPAMQPEQQEARELRDAALRVVTQEGHLSASLAPHLYQNFAILCCGRNPTGRIIAENGLQTGVAISPEGCYCAFAERGQSNGIKICSTSTGELIKTLDGHDNYVDKLAFSADRQSLVSHGVDDKICIWSFLSGLLQQQKRIQSGFGLAFSPDAKAIRLSLGPDGKHWLNIDKNSFFDDSNIEGHVIGYPERGELVYISRKGTFLYDYNKHEELCSLPSHINSRNISDIIYDNHSHVLAVSTEDTPQKITLWTLQKNHARENITIKIPCRPIGMLFNRDASLLAVYYEGGANIYDVKKGSLVQVLDYGPKYPVHNFPIAFDHSGQIITIGFDSKVRIFNSLPTNIHAALQSLSLNQLIILMQLIRPLALGRVIHLTQGSNAWNLVHTMPEPLRDILAPCLQPAGIVSRLTQAAQQHPALLSSVAAAYYMFKR